MKHNNFLYKTLLILLVSTKVVANTIEIEKITTNEQTKEVLEIKIIPRIKLTEINSLKSYMWWNAKTSDTNKNDSNDEVKGFLNTTNGSKDLEDTQNQTPKVPIAFKSLLKKMSDDFLKENINIKFYLSDVKSNNIRDYENYYLITGNLIIDSKNKEMANLTELSFYQIKNSSLNLLFLSKTAVFTSDSSFRGLATEFNEKINNKVFVKSEFKTSEFIIVFENELNYEELDQIRQSIKDSLDINIDQIKLYSSETNKYTFKLFVTQNPFRVLKSINYINGPYNPEVFENQITFKTFTDDEVLEP